MVKALHIWNKAVPLASFVIVMVAVHLLDFGWTPKTGLLIIPLVAANTLAISGATSEANSRKAWAVAASG